MFLFLHRLSLIMKSNNIPRADRLRRRIENLARKLYEFGSRPYGGGNPYSYCGACGRSMVEASNAGHYKGCQRVGIENEIAYYRGLLDGGTETIGDEGIDCQAPNTFGRI